MRKRSSTVAVPQSNFVERVDSGETDESPFGSSLTTPVDENVELFKGIHQRLAYSSGISHSDYFSKRLRDSLTGVSVSRVPSIDSVKDGDAKPRNVRDVVLPTIQRLVSSRTSSGSSSDRDSIQESSFQNHRRRSSSIYTLPNAPIFIEQPGQPVPIVSDQKRTLQSAHDSSATVPKEMEFLYDFSELPFANEDDKTSMDDTAGFDVEEEDKPFVGWKWPTVNELPALMIKLVCFLPWCVAVGGCIVMFPHHLESVVFDTGYMEPLQGIRRFAHWADCGKEHIAIFLGFLAFLVWLHPNIGLLCAGAVTAQFLHAWQDFRLDRSIPLGEDDRQSIYLVLTDYGASVESLEMCKTDQGYVLSHKHYNSVERHDDSDG